MADPKQLRILKMLTEHLEGINPGNDNPATNAPFTFDLQGKIVRGLAVLPVDEAEDKLSILEFPRQEFYVSADDEKLQRQEQWQLMVQGWPKNDPENPGDPAYAMKAEVEVRLSMIAAQKPNGRGPVYPNLYMLPDPLSGEKQIMSLTIAPGVVRPPEDAASRLAMFYIPLIIGLRVDLTNPY